MKWGGWRDTIMGYKVWRYTGVGGSMEVVVGLYAGSGDVCCPAYNYNHNNHEYNTIIAKE